MLIGIGLGPGSPDLLTLAAIKALKESKKVFAPGKLAAELVAPYAKAQILEFPMIHDRAELSRLWEDNAKIVADEARNGMVSFAVIGDPNFFSTFTHLRRTINEKYPHIRITTIPGVSAITAQAARTDTAVEGSFIVSDGSPVRTKIILKTKNPEKTKGKKSGGVVYFVGAGPGNPKYITVKGRELLESADLVMYTGSLINPAVLQYAHCEKIDSHGMRLENIVDLLAKDAQTGKRVVRLHSGDPSLYGAIIEQIDGLNKCGIDIEIIPGVTSLFASAAALRTQLTLNGVTETLIITRPAGATLEKDSLRELSRHNATMAIYLGTHKLREITSEVAYPAGTPAAVVYHASWDDEKIILGTVGDIADRVEALGIDKSAMIIIGNVLSPRNYKRSHLYG